MSTAGLRKLFNQGRQAELPDALSNCSPETLKDLPPYLLAAALDHLFETERPEDALSLDERCHTAGAYLPLSMRLVDYLLSNGHTKAARDRILREPAAATISPWDYASRIKALIKLGDIAQAGTLVNAALETHPDTPVLQALKAHVAFHANAPTETLVTLFRAAARSASGKDAEHLNRFALLLETEQTSLAGFDISLPRALASPTIAAAVVKGGYEAAERAAVVHGLTEQDRVLELGAGIGLIALTVNRALPGIPILSVEANPALATVIRENFARNTCTADLVEGIAALEDGETDFHVAPDFWASSTQALDEDTQTIRHQSLDTNRLIREFAPTILVMDIEGGEIALLPHLDLTGIRRLIIEFHPAICPPEDISAALAHLLAQGFALDLGQGSKQVLVFDRTRPADHD